MRIVRQGSTLFNAVHCMHVCTLDVMGPPTQKLCVCLKVAVIEGSCIWGKHIL